MTANTSVGFDDLAAGQRAGICWVFFWRAIVVAIVSVLIGAIAGFILGLVLGFTGHALGWQTQSVRGAARWSGYRLRLVRQENA